MTLFLATLVVFLLVVAGLGIRVLLGRGEFRKSCSGSALQDDDVGCCHCGRKAGDACDAKRRKDDHREPG